MCLFHLGQSVLRYTQVKLYSKTK